MTFDSTFASSATQIPVMMKSAGMMVIVISVSFHWTTKATTNAAMNVVMFWMVKASLSEMPLLIRAPFVAFSVLVILIPVGS